MLALLALAAWCGPPAVAVMPRAGNTGNSIAFYDVVSLQLLNRVPDVGADIIQILPLPDGSKSFLISRSSSPVIVLDGKYGNPRAIGGRLALAPSAALMSPDGSRVVVAAGGVYFFDTVSESLTLADGLAVPGGTPIDLAVTFDSKRVFVLAQSDDGKIQLTAIENERIANTLTLPGDLNSPPTGLLMAPNGRLYLFTNLRIYEIDARTNRVTRNGEILITGYAGKGAAASPDGRYILVPNARPAQGATPLYQLDTFNKTAFPASPLTGQDAFERLQPTRTIIGTEQMIGLTKSGRLFDIRFGNPSPSIVPANADSYFTEGPDRRPSYSSVAFSNEFFPRKMAIIKTDADQSALFSVDLLDQRLARLALENLPWRVALVTPSALSGTLRMLQMNPSQIVPSGGRSPAPLVVRCVEPEGKGVFGAPVTFTTSAPGVAIESSVALAGAEGYAQTYVTAGDVAGPFSVIATTPGAPPVTFTLNVPATPNGADLSGLFVYSGNGLVVREGARAPQPMVAQLRDLNGNPVAGASVRWTIKQGLGGASGGGGTDANGLARATFNGDIVTTSTSYAQTIIEASTATGRATFYGTSVPKDIPGRGLAPDPTVTSNLPTSPSFTGPSGGVIRNAIVARITNSIGPEAGLGIPNVGLRGSVVEGAVTAECNAEVLTDATGAVACDLKLGPRTGVGTLRFNMGEFLDLPLAQLTVTVGGPGKVLIVTGNNQTAPVNQSLPTPLTARVTDAGGNVLNNVPVNWTVTRGTAVLDSARSVTDSNGNTSIRAGLGATPGPVTVRAAVDNDIFVNFTMTATVTYGGLRITGGDDQQALTGAAFTEPLAVEVRDNGGAIVPGVPVQFAVTGGPTILSAASALTDSNGIARVTASAGTVAGSSIVTASIGRFAESFLLRTRPRAPIVDLTGIRNAFSGEPGLTPCGLSSITGTFLAAGVGGTIHADMNATLPVALSTIESITIDGVPAGIVSVTNFSGVERVVIQTPCEVNGPQAGVTIKAAGLNAATVADVPVLAYQPAILEVTGADGKKYASSTAVKRGATVQLTVTGLGQTLPPILTRAPGIAGQAVQAALTAGLNDQGVRIVRAEYAAGQAGVYIVEIEIPPDAAAGSYQPVVIGLTPPNGGEPLYSPAAYLMIE